MQSWYDSIIVIIYHFTYLSALLAEEEKSSFAQLSADSYMIFTVNIPEDGVYPVTLLAYACGSQVICPFKYH